MLELNFGGFHMSDNFLYDLSVKFFKLSEIILSKHIHNWYKLDFSHQAACFFWGCFSILFYLVLYSIVLFFSLKFFPVVVNACMNRSNESNYKKYH